MSGYVHNSSYRTHSVEKSITDQKWNYAHLTFMTGARPFDGVEMILENMVSNLRSVTAHPDGSYSETKNTIARNAISDTAIIMSYSLLEGFFSEEYAFYIKKEKPKKLSAMINELLHTHSISIKEWRERRKKVDMVRELRNAVAHNNGILEKNINIEKYENVFGENIFSVSEKYPRLSVDGSLSLVREFRSIANEYAEAVFTQPNK
ncbi:hypothetical protein [Endozoicomonas sp. ALB032]|uniref:hypothetical protein n=1 Tax=Endozoicomonas sp. ALB032 TaxID=3403082 RepID=UPI003BB797D5